MRRVSWISGGRGEGSDGRGGKYREGFAGDFECKCVVSAQSPITDLKHTNINTALLLVIYDWLKLFDDQLDVQIGIVRLIDRVEWDLSSSLTPESFTSILVRDLGLSSAASPLISHAIHEELLRHKKNCLEIGLFEAGVRKTRGARPLEGVWREWSETANFGPRVEVLSLDAIDRLENEKDRAAIRAKRERLDWPRNRRR